MKRQKGFSLLEMMIATVILVSAVGSAMVALLQAQHATQGITLLASTQQNLRAGMHFIVRDLTQAGAGIPQGGVTIPYNASAVSNLNRPGTIPQTIFSSAYTVLPPIVPGNVAGQLATSVNPSTLAVLTGHNTDIINIMYADNTLVDVSGNWLNSYPIVQVLPSTPVCAGLITSIAVTLATNCFTMPGTAGTVPLAVGNLIMFTGSAGNAFGIHHRGQRPGDFICRGRSGQLEWHRLGEWDAGEINRRRRPDHHDPGLDDYLLHRYGDQSLAPAIDPPGELAGLSGLRSSEPSDRAGGCDRRPPI